MSSTQIAVKIGYEGSMLWRCIFSRKKHHIPDGFQGRSLAHDVVKLRPYPFPNICRSPSGFILCTQRECWRQPSWTFFSIRVYQPIPLLRNLFTPLLLLPTCTLMFLLWKGSTLKYSGTAYFIFDFEVSKNLDHSFLIIRKNSEANKFVR